MNIVNKKINIDLVSRENFTVFIAYIQRVIAEWNFDAAKDFVIFFKAFLLANPKFEQTYPEEYKTYNNLFIKCEFLVLNTFALPELVDFFKEHWVEQYEIPFFTDSKANVFFDLFDACMMGELIYEDRDEWKNRIIQSLKNNKQLIFKFKNSQLSVAELLINFANQLINKELNIITITNYLDVKQKEFGLDETIRNKIGHLLKFYKTLTTSSMDAEGAEEVVIYVDEVDHKFKALKKGVIEEIKMDNLADIEKTIATLYEIRNKNNVAESDYKFLIKAYKLTQVDWNKVVSEANKLAGAVNIQSEFQKDFHNAINTKNTLLLISYLFILARQGVLDEIFERDEKIKEIFKAHLAKKFSVKLAEHFEHNLRAPVYLSYFLQHILKDILKFDENESAVLAIKLVNELKRSVSTDLGQVEGKQYLSIAYGDLPTGTFKWKEIMEKDDSLELQE